MVALAFVAIAFASPSFAFAAVARDASSQINGSGAWSDWNTTGTWSHTTTGANRILLCGIETQPPTADTYEILTGVTYNGNVMTQLVKRQRSDSAQVWQYLYYILDSGMPTSGNAADVVATVSQRSQYSYGGCASYTGVNQSAPEASGGVDSAGTATTVTLTTIADNAWLVGFAFNSGGQTVTASTNTTEFNTILAWGRMFDTNAAQTPAGSHSMAVTHSNTLLPVFLAASIAPVAAVVTPSSVLASILEWFDF